MYLHVSYSSKLYIWDNYSLPFWIQQKSSNTEHASVLRNNEVHYAVTRPYTEGCYFIKGLITEITTCQIAAA